MTITCITIKPDGSEKVMENITLGYIPIMLGSIKCNLHGKTKEELVRLGECLTDPFGYFIISTERTVINIDKININMTIIKTGKDDPKPFAVNNYTPRRRVVLHCSKKWNSIVMDDPLDDNVWKEDGTESRRLPLFVVYYILTGMKPEETIQHFILPLFPKKYHRRIINALTESVIEFKSIKDIYQYLYILRNQKDPAMLEKDQVRKIFDEHFYVQVFDHLLIESERYEAKLISFSLVVAKFLHFFIGEISTDDINSWVSKRFETPAVSMEILFESIFDQVIKVCRKTQVSTGSQWD